MKFIKERHLRVKTPITVDGLQLAYDSFNRPKFSITHLPLTAKVHLEKANKRLPTHLRKIIEIIDPIEAPDAKVLHKKLINALDVNENVDDDVQTEVKTKK